MMTFALVAVAFIAGGIIGASVGATAVIWDLFRPRTTR